MSNSAKAKERRSRRGRATKHQRTRMASQHFDNVVSVRKAETKSTKRAPSELSAIEQRMQEMKRKLGG